LSGVHSGSVIELTFVRFWRHRQARQWCCAMNYNIGKDVPFAALTALAYFRVRRR
jgi:hypothetical protein